MPFCKPKNSCELSCTCLYMKSLSLLGLEHNKLSKLVPETCMCMGNTCSYSVMLLSIEWWSVKLDISFRSLVNAKLIVKYIFNFVLVLLQAASDSSR